MSALLKYEIRKTWIAKAILLGITAVAELVFLVGLAGDSRLMNDILGTGIALLVFTAIGGILFIGIQSIVTLHRDMNTKQGYMLYMTPRNSFQILGAKMLENGISLLLAGAFFSLLALADVSLLFGKSGQLEQLWEAMKKMVAMFNSELNLDRDGFLVLMLLFLTSWLSTVSVAYLADIISSALLNGKKGNGLITFLLFVLLSLLCGWLERLCVAPGTAVRTSFVIQSLVAVGYSAVMYVISAVIMDRYLSV